MTDPAATSPPKQILVLQGFVIRPEASVVDLGDQPTITRADLGEQHVAADDVVAWFTDTWPDLWDQIQDQFKLRAQAVEAQQVKANRATRRSTAKKPAAGKPRPAKR